MTPTRGQLHAELEQHINALTQTRDNTEYVERRTTNRNGKRARRRTPHHVTLPALMDALNDALVPAISSSTNGAPNTGFESRPAADLEPAAVHHAILQAATQWAHQLGVPPTLTALLNANPTDAQLEQLVHHAAHWVARAREAAGEDPTERVIGDACVYCGHRNSIAVNGDLTTARCTRCGVRWDLDTIGLLSQMLRANREHETLALARCWMADCTRYGDHDQHQDGRGRTWGDQCPIPVTECSR